MSLLKPVQVQDLLINMNKFIDRSSVINVVNEHIDVICLAGLSILFLCLMIKFLLDCLAGGYNINVLKKYLFLMVILGVIISPVVYKSLILIYTQLYDFMIDKIGNARIEELRDAMYKIYRDIFDAGEAGTKKLFGILPIKTTPLIELLAHFSYLIFIISMYELLMLPNILIGLVILLVPIILGFSPILEEMKQKVAEMLFGFAFVFPAVLFGLGTFLPISITLATELLERESMLMLFVLCLAYSAVVAYSIPMVGYISGVSFLSELRVIFPMAAGEYICTKFRGFIAGKIGGKNVG